MKKIFIIALLLFPLIILNGCFYTDDSKKDMELIDVKVYDADENEIVGEFKDYYREFNDTNLKLSKGIKLNSAAPVINYYFVEGKTNTEYKVKFFFTSKRNKEMVSLVVINFKDYTRIECDDIEVVDGKIIATITLNNLSNDYKMFKVYNWRDNNKTYSFGEMGSNTYIKGVYFNLINNEV